MTLPSGGGGAYRFLFGFWWLPLSTSIIYTQMLNCLIIYYVLGLFFSFKYNKCGSLLHSWNRFAVNTGCFYLEGSPDVFISHLWCPVMDCFVVLHLAQIEFVHFFLEGLCCDGAWTKQSGRVNTRWFDGWFVSAIVLERRHNTKASSVLSGSKCIWYVDSSLIGLLVYLHWQILN